MQPNATGSHSAVADGSSLHSALFSLGYSDLEDRHLQNHVMAGFPLPPSLGEDMISFSRGQVSSRVGDELWSSQPAGKDGVSSSIHDMEGLTSSRVVRPSPYPFEPPITVVDSTFEGTGYSYEGQPFDASTRWGSELQQSLIMNEWILTEQERLEAINPGPSRFSKELSLSLASSHPCVVSIQEQGSELSCSGVTSHPLPKRHVGSDNTSCSSSSLSLNLSPSKSLLSGSRFFQAMQEILAEFACYALENLDQTRGASTNGLDSDHRLVFYGKEAEHKKKHLLSLLQVVDDQYNQCLDEIHTIVSAFHVVTELDPNLHARFALPAISLMYRNLRERISSHILAMGAHHSEGDNTREESSFETSFIQQQWALQQLKKRDHQLWRPQRGLPERSVSVLRAWMFQNFLHPYPKDAEKHLLALKSGLTRSQVSNWFINARVRLWKPMIEEMYAEMNRRKARRDEEESNGSHRNHLSRRFTVD